LLGEENILRFGETRSREWKLSKGKKGGTKGSISLAEAGNRKCESIQKTSFLKRKREDYWDRRAVKTRGPSLMDKITGRERTLKGKPSSSNPRKR